jgi:hypothetical protein
MAIACDTNSLVQAATCIDCNIPVGMRDAVLIYVLATKAGVSTKPQDLIDAARQIDCCVPVGMRQAIIARLLCTLADQGGA